MTVLTYFPRRYTPTPMHLDKPETILSEDLTAWFIEKGQSKFLTTFADVDQSV